MCVQVLTKTSVIIKVRDQAKLLFTILCRCLSTYGFFFNIKVALCQISWKVQQTSLVALFTDLLVKVILHGKFLPFSGTFTREYFTKLCGFVVKFVAIL